MRSQGWEDAGGGGSWTIVGLDTRKEGVRQQVGRRIIEKVRLGSLSLEAGRMLIMAK